MSTLKKQKTKGYCFSAICSLTFERANKQGCLNNAETAFKNLLSVN